MYSNQEDYAKKIPGSVVYLSLLLTGHSESYINRLTTAVKSLTDSTHLVNLKKLEVRLEGDRPFPNSC
jgi:hypothetical protein